MPPGTEALNADIAGSYDEVTYGSPAHRPAHPVRLATAAALRGLSWAAVGRCRVFEVGCAEGGHLLPLAEAYPDSEFVGVDLSRRQVELANERIAELGLSNVAVHQLDLREVDDTFGEFDYVIAHGVYSWVPPAVRDRLMGVCRERLAPTGIAYVSYNTYPGWQVAGVLRQVILGQLDRAAPLGQRIAAARSIADDVGRRVDHETPYGAMLLQAAAQVATAEDGYLAHEFLELVNDPVPLTQFVQHAMAHGLHYVDDMVVRNELPPGDLAHQQYADLLTGTPFRAAVLSRQPPTLHGVPGADRIGPLVAAMWATGDVNPVESAGAAATFGTPKGRLTIDSPALARLLTEIGRRRPASMPVGDLVGDDHDASGGLYAMHRRGALELLVEPLPMGTVLGGRPRVAAVTRLQARLGPLVSNAALDRHALDEFDRALIGLLDGTRTHDDLVAALDAPAELVADRLGQLAALGLLAP
jgi:trans-aconitate methyltransferase